MEEIPSHGVNEGRMEKGKVFITKGNPSSRQTEKPGKRGAKLTIAHTLLTGKKDRILKRRTSPRGKRRGGITKG